jgi:hypothetical protein
MLIEITPIRGLQTKVFEKKVHLPIQFSRLLSWDAVFPPLITDPFLHGDPSNKNGSSQKPLPTHLGRREKGGAHSAVQEEVGILNRRQSGVTGHRTLRIPLALWNWLGVMLHPCAQHCLAPET